MHQTAQMTSQGCCRRTHSLGKQDGWDPPTPARAEKRMIPMKIGVLCVKMEGSCFAVRSAPKYSIFPVMSLRWWAFQGNYWLFQFHLTLHYFSSISHCTKRHWTCIVKPSKSSVFFKVLYPAVLLVGGNLNFHKASAYLYIFLQNLAKLFIYLTINRCPRCDLAY